MSTTVLHQANSQGAPRSVLRPSSTQSIVSLWNVVVPYLALFKFRIVLLLIVVAGASATIAQRGMPPAGRLGLLLLAGTLASAGASALNHYLDRDLDPLMERTRRRPLPSGRIGHPGRAAILGLGLVLVSLPIALRLNVTTALYILAGALFYVLVYTWWLKRRSKLNVVMGGAAGSFAALAGWSVVDSGLAPLAFLIATMAFLWTPLHFWNFALVNIQDYRRARVPMLPLVVGEEKARQYIAVAALSVFVCSLLPWLWGYLGSYYLMSALALSLLLGGNLRLVGSPGLAWRNYKLSGLYLMGILLAMAVDATFQTPPAIG